MHSEFECLAGFSEKRWRQISACFIEPVRAYEKIYKHSILSIESFDSKLLEQPIRQSARFTAILPRP